MATKVTKKQSVEVTVPSGVVKPKVLTAEGWRRRFLEPAAKKGGSKSKK